MRRIWLVISTAMALAAGCVVRPAPPAALEAHPPEQRAAAPSALDLALRAIGDHRVVLLGEMHGTRETPTLAGQLVSHYVSAHQPVLLGLEVDRDEQGDVDRFLSSHGDAVARGALLAGAQWQAPFDGRDSGSMFELIEHVRRLRASGADVRIVYFDSHDLDMNQRNRRMAGTLRAAAATNPGEMLLVLTGNVHAMTRRPPGEMYSEEGKRIEPPMTAGRYLADLQPVSIDIGAATGEFWACRQKVCGRQAVFPRTAQSEPALVETPPTESAWDFTMTLPRFHASTPAILAKVSP